MSAFDELGAGLGSLSLGDLGKGKAMYDPEDDCMDIDSSESLMNIMDHTDGEQNIRHRQLAEIIDADADCFEEEETNDGNSSFIHSLNPTTLGAKYALKPLKLLMPPPEKTDHGTHEYEIQDHVATSPSAEHDYEFDTSMSTSYRKNSSSATAHNRYSGELDHSSQNHNFISGHQEAPPLVSEMWPHDSANEYMLSRSHRWLQGLPDRVQIHHHHYYSPEKGLTHFARERDLPQFSPQFSPTLWNDHSKNTQAVNQASPDVNSVATRNNESSMQSMQNQHPAYFPNIRATSGVLPSPWDPRSVPAERAPYVLASYLQLLINVILSGYAVHIVVAMIQAIRQDVAHKLEQEANSLLIEIASCERAYHENHCSPETIVPALEKMCAHWEKCMRQNPAQIGNRSSVGAHTIGVIVNSLIEPLSFKVFVVGAAAIMTVFACNFAFGYFRAKTYYGWSSAAARHV